MLSLSKTRRTREQFSPRARSTPGRVLRVAQMRYPMEAPGRGCGRDVDPIGQHRTSGGRLAQRESASFTPRRSLVRSQYRPPMLGQVRGSTNSSHLTQRVGAVAALGAIWEVFSLFSFLFSTAAVVRNLGLFVQVRLVWPHKGAAAAIMTSCETSSRRSSRCCHAI
jgi:hypothetical protein